MVTDCFICVRAMITKQKVLLIKRLPIRSFTFKVSRAKTEFNIIDVGVISSVYILKGT